MGITKMNNYMEGYHQMSAAAGPTPKMFSAQSSSATTDPAIQTLRDSYHTVAEPLSELLGKLPIGVAQYLAKCFGYVGPENPELLLEFCEGFAKAIAQFEQLSGTVLGAIREAIESHEKDKDSCGWSFTEAEYQPRRTSIAEALKGLLALNAQVTAVDAVTLVRGIWGALDTQKYRPFVQDNSVNELDGTAVYPEHGMCILSHCGYSKSIAYLLALYIVLEKRELW